MVNLINPHALKKEEDQSLHCIYLYTQPDRPLHF